MVRSFVLAILSLMLLWAATDWNPPGEFLVMPGKVIAGHEKWERQCKECHKRFDRQGQPSLCLGCHRDIRSDIDDRRYHFYLAGQPCSRCHPDHKGRDAQVVVFERSGFDHDQSRYRLREGHVQVECEKCHTKATKSGTSFHSRISRQCMACHEKDDVHKGETSGDCDGCHDEVDWKRATNFDHEATEFPLRPGRHVEVACAECHKTENLFRLERKECVDCHGRPRKMEPEHRRRYGDRCGDCHAGLAWKTIHFRHDADTDYALLAKHRDVKCDACHLTGPEIRRRNGSHAGGCIACETGKSVARLHLGRAAGSCRECHGESRCADVRANRGERKDVAALRCEDCHVQDRQVPSFARKIDARCVTCHVRNDTEHGHKGAFGDRCEACHDERSWRLWAP